MHVYLPAEAEQALRRTEQNSQLFRTCELGTLRSTSWNPWYVAASCVQEALISDWVPLKLKNHLLTLWLWFSSYVGLVGPVWLTLPRRQERHVKQHLLLLSQVPTLQRTPHSGNRSNCTCHSSFSMIFLLYGFREISTKSQVQQVFEISACKYCNHT